MMGYKATGISNMEKDTVSTDGSQYVRLVTCQAIFIIDNKSD